MAADMLTGVVWCDSYLLGWVLKGESIQLFLEVLLTDQHPQYEPFDPKKEYGCYKTATLTLAGASKSAGRLPVPEFQPKWNEELGEYQDAAEIDSLVMDNQRLSIEANGEMFTIVFDRVDFLIGDIDSMRL